VGPTDPPPNRPASPNPHHREPLPEALMPLPQPRKTSIYTSLLDRWIDARKVVPQRL